ncbi:MAG TPA: hypothetical protein VJ851_16770 [Jatrophihabitans sp.]|nr:hypothetical protein [Jatrophihabitans sp.]
MSRKSTLAAWLGWSLGLGLLPLGLGWLEVWFNQLHHMPSLQQAFGSGRPALSSVGLLAPALRQATTDQRHWMAPWLLIGMLGAVGVYALSADKAGPATSNADQHLVAVLALATLGIATVMGGVAMLVTYKEKP